MGDEHEPNFYLRDYSWFNSFYLSTIIVLQAALLLACSLSDRLPA